MRSFKLFLLIYFISFLYITNSYSQWFWQNPVPQGNVLFQVYFTDANIGTAVGFRGTILRTTDGGATWTSQTSGTSYYLSGVSFIDANNGIAVGFYGTIVRTTDGGATWNIQTSGTKNTLHSISYSDTNNGTAVGTYGTILRTIDGGGM